MFNGWTLKISELKQENNCEHHLFRADQLSWNCRITNVWVNAPQQLKQIVERECIGSPVWHNRCGCWFVPHTLDQVYNEHVSVHYNQAHTAKQKELIQSYGIPYPFPIDYRSVEFRFVPTFQYRISHVCSCRELEQIVSYLETLRVPFSPFSTTPSTSISFATLFLHAHCQLLPDIIYLVMSYVVI